MTWTPDQRLFGAYELLEPLGKGGMAQVWRARHRGAAGAERQVVLKRILPFAPERRETMEQLFVTEARLTLRPP